MSDSNTVRLSAGFDRQYVRINHRSVRYLVVEVTAPPAPEQIKRSVADLNLGLVLDASGSMNARDAGGDNLPLSRLEAAKQASDGVVHNLGEDDALSLVSFADQAIVHLSGLGLDADGKREAAAAIAAIGTRGCTNLHDGWLAGAEQVALHMEHRPNDRHRVLLLSDGMANRGITDPETLGEIAAELRSRGISTSTVGIGLDYSTEQIGRIAEDGGGMLHHATHPAEIVEVVLAELKEMQATVVDDVEISVDMDGEDGGVGIEVVGLGHRDHPGGACAVLGSLVGQATRRAVFRLFVPPGVNGEVLTCRIAASWRAAGQSERQRVQAEVSLTRQPDTQVFGEATDQAIALEAAKAWQGAVVQRAVELNRREQYREAQRYTREQLDHFRRYCGRLEDGEELLAGLEKTLRRIGRPMREYNRKEISTAMYKRQRMAKDWRSEAPEAWDKLLDD